MKKQRGFGFLHLLLVLTIAITGAAVWKYQQRKDAVLAKQQSDQKASETASEIAAEQRQLAEINLKVAEAHRQELEIQRRVYESINKEIPAPDQSNLTSKSLPYLTWEATRIGMTKAEMLEFAQATKSFIRASLKDPGSAEFAGMKIFKASHSDGSYTFICGKVNAKNSFGGYVGFENYIVYKNDSGAIEGGVGDKGDLAVVRSDGKWWRYDGDDMCLVHGFSIAEATGS